MSLIGERFNKVLQDTAALLSRVFIHHYRCVTSKINVRSCFITIPSTPVVSILAGIQAITLGISNGLTDKYAPSHQGRMAKSWWDSVSTVSESLQNRKNTVPP